jgi:hypothetical protein
VVGILSTDLAATLSAQARIAGAHLCVTDREASAARTDESRNRNDILAAPGWIILVEGCDVESVRGTAADLRARMASLIDGAIIAGLYRFEFQSQPR